MKQNTAYCVWCGYQIAEVIDLEDDRYHRCPECGEQYVPSDPTTYDPHLDVAKDRQFVERAWRAIGCLIIVVMGIVILAGGTWLVLLRLGIT